jgi:hypothetical protein
MGKPQTTPFFFFFSQTQNPQNKTPFLVERSRWFETTQNSGDRRKKSGKVYLYDLMRPWTLLLPSAKSAPICARKSSKAWHKRDARLGSNQQRTQISPEATNNSSNSYSEGKRK